MDLAGLFEQIRHLRGGTPFESAPYVVVGTGNPGPEYRNTRHNAGFWCIDRLAERADAKLKRAHRHAVIAIAELGGEPVVLVKPRTFVNLSGLAAAYALNRFAAGPERLIAVVDDIHLPPGSVRVRSKGGSGGHKGLKSIAERIGTSDFARVRIGVGAPDDPSDQVRHVLSTLPSGERKLVDEAVERAADAVAAILTDGIEPAMSRYN